MSSFGELISDLRIENLDPRVLILTPCVELLLRLLIALTITTLIDRPVFAIIVLNFAFLLYAAFMLTNSPHEDQNQSKIIKFNSIAYLAVNYHLYLFTGFAKPSAISIIANSVISIVAFIFCLNLLLTSWIQSIAGIKRLKRIYFRGRRNKRVNSRETDIS